eukprot:SAG11_NODE_288_length_11198_cov_29.339130_10_plen_222_part_00
MPKQKETKKGPKEKKKSKKTHFPRAKRATERKRAHRLMVSSESESSADEGQSELADSIKTHEGKRKPKEQSSKDDPPKVSFNLTTALSKIPKKIPPRPKFSPNPTYGEMEQGEIHHSTTSSGKAVSFSDAAVRQKKLPKKHIKNSTVVDLSGAQDARGDVTAGTSTSGSSTESRYDLTTPDSSDNEQSTLHLEEVEGDDDDGPGGAGGPRDDARNDVRCRR